MREPFVIEPMQHADVAAVSAIDGSPAGREDDLRAELERPWARPWVAREAEGAPVVAFVVTWFVVDEVHVLSIATRPDVRRRGAARALMDEVLAFARSRAARQLLLEVRRSNRPAIALYRSLGFFASSVRARYYADDEDAIEMVLALDPATGAVLRRDDEVSVEPT